MIFEQVEIKNILGCSHAVLHFNSDSNAVYVVQSKKDCPIGAALITAVHLICSGQYATLESLAQLNNVKGGSVRVVFAVPIERVDANLEDLSDDENDSDFNSDEPSTSQQADAHRERCRLRQLRRQRDGSLQFCKVEAWRDLTDSPKLIHFRVNNKSERQCSPSLFHGLFCTSVEYTLSRFDGAEKSWLEVFLVTLNNQFTGRETVENQFEHFIQLVMQKTYSSEHIIHELTSGCLLANSSMKTIKQSAQLQVFCDVCRLFEYISCQEYKVWFFMCRTGEFVDFLNIPADESKCYDDIHVYLGLSKSTEKYHWKEIEHGVQEMLLVAFQLTLAFHCRQSVVYLQDTDALRIYQANRMATAAFLQNENDTQIKWVHKNYFGRIVDVCLQIGITAFIEYHGVISLMPGKAQIIKCYKDVHGWTMKVAESKPITSNILVETVERYLG